MFTEHIKASPPSFGEKITKWLPALPSIPSIHSWNACKDAIHSLTSSFRYPHTPVSERISRDLTEVNLPASTQRETPNKERRRYAMYAVATATCMTACGILQYFRSQMPQLYDGQSISQSFDPAIPSPVAESADESLQFAGRRLLHSVVPLSLPSTINNCSIFGTEEVPLSQSFNTWDVFPFLDQGRLIASNLSALPPGIDLVQSPIRIVNSISLTNNGPAVNKGNALYVASGLFSGVQPVQIVNTADISNPYVQNVFNSGMDVTNMMIQGNQLVMTGYEAFLKFFDISDPFNPILQGATATNVHSLASAIATSGINNQFGCVTSNGFFYVDGTNFNVTGMIPNISGYGYNGLTPAIAASEDCYFFAALNGNASQTGLVSVNATPSSAPIGFLPLAYITSIVYENGYCIVGSFNGISIVDVQDPANMQVVYYFPSPANSFLSSGNLLYYTTQQSSGIGIIDKTNITNPIFLAYDFLNEIPIPLGSGSLLPLDNDIIVTSGNIVYFITSQDAFSFSGTPTAGSQGSYPVTLKATSLSGQVLNQTQVCNVTISPAITSTSPIPKLIAGVNQAVSTIIPVNTFKQVLGLPMTYSLECQPGNINDLMSLNPVSGQFSGTPQVGDVGSATCIVKATDSFSASATSSPFNITVTYGPTLKTISNQIAVIGEPFSLNLTATSQDPSSTFTFTVSNLPSSFTYANGTITGIPTSENLGIYSISVTVTDQNAISNKQSFTFNVIQPGFPVFVRPLSSVVVFIGNPFTIQVPPDSAVNINNPNAQITYSATLADGSPLPHWISFDGTTFRGTPPDTAKIYYDTTQVITLKAIQSLPNGQEAVSISNFNITVSGTSIYQILINVGSPLLTILAATYAKRVRLHNAFIKVPCMITSINRVKSIFYCCHCQKTQFHQAKEDFFEGQSLAYTFKSPWDKIAGFKTIYDNNKLCFEGALPYWLKEEEVSGGRKKIMTKYVPELHGVGSISITPFDSTGYHLETVTFTKAQVKTDNFSRPCKSPVDQIKNVKFFLGNNSRPEINNIDGLSYDQDSNSIIALNVSIQPITVLIMGERNVILETIHINQRPSDMGLLSSDGFRSDEETYGNSEFRIDVPPSPSSHAGGSMIELSLLSAQPRQREFSDEKND